MPLDHSLIGVESAPHERSWTSADTLLYALGVGAGTDELAFTTENSAGIRQRVLPTFAVLAAQAPTGRMGSATSTRPCSCTPSRRSSCTASCRPPVAYGPPRR